jgi:hypothetical protein
MLRLGRLFIPKVTLEERAMMHSLILALALGQIAPAEAHTGKSGQTIWITAPKTAPVATIPTLTVNGQAVVMTQGSMDPAFWSFGLAAPVNGSDQLHLSAPAGWAAGAPALEMDVRNSTGRLEFTLPAPTMALGLNMAAQSLTSIGFPHANWARRLSWDAGVKAYDALGYPSSLAPAGAHGNFLQGHFGGLWSVAYNAVDPATVAALAYYAGPHVPVYRPELSSPGVNGKGIVKVYDCAADSYASVYLYHPAGQPKIANLQVLPPGNAPSSDPLALEWSISRELSLGGGRGPSALRFMDSTAGFGGKSNVVDPSDLVDPSQLAWCFPRTARTADVRSVRAPATQTIQTTYGPVTPPPGAFIWPGTNFVIVECVCPRPHGFRTGQLVSVKLGIPSIPTTVSPATPVPPVFDTLAYVTSDTTFSCQMGAKLNGPHATLPTSEVATPAGTASMYPQVSMNLPFEFAAATAGRWTGCDLWLNLPIAATDATYDEIARRVLANLPAGHRVLLEVSNEVWNAGFPQYFYAYTMTRVLGEGGIVEGFLVRRSLEAAARFRSIFTAARRGADVLIILPGQFGAIGTSPLIPEAIKAFQKTGQVFDAITIPQYFPNIYRGGFRPDTPAQSLDSHRHYLMLSPRIDKRFFPDFARAVAAYEQAIGRRVLRYAYEGSLTSTAGAGTLPWDVTEHPDRADTLRCLFAISQANGFDLFVYFNQCAPPNGSETDGIWHWQGQFAGTGDGSDGRPANVLQGKATPGNVSPAGQAWREWQRVRPRPKPTTPPSSSSTRVRSRPRSRKRPATP